MRCYSRVANFSHPLAAPLITTAICLLVNQHPSRIDDCPCFEDTISFVSVFLCNKHQCWLLVLKTRVRAKYRPVHLRHSWRIVRLLHRNPDLGADRAVEARDRDTDHIPMAHPRQAKSNAAPAAFPMACAGESRARAAPASLYPRCEPAHTLRPVPSMIDLDLAVAQVVDDGPDVASGRRG